MRRSTSGTGWKTDIDAAAPTRRSCMSTLKRFATDPIHVLLTIKHLFSIFFFFQHVSYVPTRGHPTAAGHMPCKTL
jgi:hypothetical protein